VGVVDDLDVGLVGAEDGVILEQVGGLAGRGAAVSATAVRWAHPAGSVAAAGARAASNAGKLAGSPA
jgi:hypothetical protein